MKKISLIILLAVSSGVSVSQVNINSSLTACYAMNGNGNEPISSLTATLSAVTATLDRLSNANSALSFSGGVGSFITLPNSALLKAQAVSVSAWVKTNVNGLNQILVFAYNGCVSYHEGYQLAMLSTGPSAYRFQAVKSTSNCVLSGQTPLNGTTTTLTANTWYHVGAYFGPDSLKLYVNGVLNASLSNTNALNYSNAANVILGGTNNGSNLPFNGSMDNVRFYNRKLNGNEFNLLYTADPVCQPNPVANFSVSNPSPCVNQTITINDLSTNTPTSWAWQMNSGTPSVATVSNPAVTYSAAGIYTISLVASNAFGSSAAYSQTIAVSVCASLREINESKSYKIYPNPTSGKFVVEFENKSASEFTVFNILGEEVTRSDFETGEKNYIDLSDHPNGIYFLRFKVGDKRTTEKIMKQ
jgi:PKD repeat protein